MSERNEAVKELFEDTARYLKYDYNLRIRRETLLSFTRHLAFETVLDVPCGNGEISIAVLPKARRLVMMDISANMCSLAKENIPPGFRQNTIVHHADLFEHDFGSEQFDLVICLGLMAHVDSPRKLMEKLGSLVRPGGHLIIQNTDSAHFYYYFIRAYLWLRSLMKRSTYSLNHVPARFLERVLSEGQFQKVQDFRYNQSFLGFSNLFSNERKYLVTRRFFGTAEDPRNQSMGSDVTYLFRKSDHG